MLHDSANSSSSLEEKKFNPPDKSHSLSYDFSAKALNMSQFQSLLQNAEGLLQKNQIKEALKLYEHSLNQAEGLMNKEDFKEFFQRTIKELNLISLKLMNRKNSSEGFEILSAGHQNNLQKTIRKADDCLKSYNIKEALQTYDIAISQAFTLYPKPDFEEFFELLIKELNIFSIKLLNSDRETFCFQILTQCEQWTQPGVYGNFADLRVFIYNHFGCYYRRLKNLDLALSFLMKALKLLNVSQNDHYLGLTHMNFAAVLSHLGDHANAKTHSMQSVQHIRNEIKREKGQNNFFTESSEFKDLIIILGISYHNLGNEEEFFGNIEKSYEYFQRSINELENNLQDPHPLLTKFKAELKVFKEKYGNKIKAINSKFFNPPKKTTFLYEKEIAQNMNSRNRPKSANSNKITQMNSSQCTYIQANNLKQKDFYFMGNKIVRRPPFPKNSAIKKNNFLANTNSNNNKTELPVNLSLFKTTHERKKDLDNSNLSARSGTEINFLEKKGVLDWESDDSGLSEGEKIKKNREKFLENLNKNMQKDEFEKLNEKMTFTLDIDSKNNLNDNYNRNIINKTEKSNSLPLDKGSIDLKVYESKKKLEELEKIRLLEEKGKLEKLDNEKQTKSNEIMELNKKEKNLEKKLENLMNAISAKSTEIKSLESEENRKNKLIYDQDKEILKKIQELQELEVRFADLQQPKALINESSFPGLTTLQLQKLVKLQGIMKKVFCFSYIEKQKTNKVLVKGKDVLFPCLERNRYTKSLLKSQRKCDLLIFFEKPTRFLKYIVLIKKPSIDVYQHCFNMKEILKEKKPSLDLIQTLCKTIMNELNGCLILLENKRLCLEEFIVNNKNNLKITFAEKYELIYLNPIYSKIIGKEIIKKGPDPEELENQINLNRKKIEEMKKFEELQRLDEERKLLEKEILVKKEKKLMELKKLEEVKILEEKEAELAKKEVLQKKKERENVKRIQLFIKKKLFYRKFEINTRIAKLLTKRTLIYKGHLLWFKIMKRKRKSIWNYSTIFYFFDNQHHIIFKKILNISESLFTKLKQNLNNFQIFFSISLIRKDVTLKDVNLLTNILQKTIGLITTIRKNQINQLYRFAFVSIFNKAKSPPPKKQEKKDEKVFGRKEMPTQALLEKKEEIKIRKSFQKTMSIVNEDVEKEDSAKEDIQQIISEESFEKPEPNNEKKKNQKIVRKYLSEIESLCLSKYFSIKKSTNTFFLFLLRKKMKKAFSSMKSCPNKQKNEVNINNEDFLRTFVILDNLAQKQKVKVFYQKQTNSLVLKAEDPNIQTKKVKIDKNCSPVEFFELYQKNFTIIRQKKEAKILFYSPEDLDRIKKIQIFQSKRFYKYNFNLKLLKSGVEIELKISKIDAKTSSIHFLTVDRKNSKTALYEIPLSSIGSFQKNEYERCVTDHILSHLQMKENGLVYVSMEDQKKSLFLKKETISLINFEKDFELHFLFDSERKFIQVLCYENREFKLEIPIKDDSSHNKLQQLCDKILLEIVVLFKSGAPQFFPSKDYSLDHYEILDEKKFDSQNTRFCTTKIIEKEGSIYLINTNKQKNINGLIQEACFLGKKENKPQILDKFQKSQFKKLLYDREFFGIDDTEFFEQMKEDDKSLISSTNSKSLIYSSKPNTEEDLNEAASKIQSQYKKKNKDQTQKKPIAINNDPKKDISLRTIREETETRNSHETNFDETSFNKKDDSNIQGKIEMEFDQEMNQAALKIQQHYRNKNTGKKNNLKMNQKNPKKQYNEKLNQPKLSQFSDTKFDKKIEKNKQNEIVDMQFDEEMDKAAKIIQEKYRKKQQNRQQNTQEKKEFDTKKKNSKEKNVQIQNKNIQPVNQKPSDEVLDMKFDEEMEQAAKKIQDKYRKKQNDRQKLPQVEIKKPVLEPKKQIPDEILDMKFDEEMDQAAKKIQSKYRKKQSNRQKQENNKNQKEISKNQSIEPKKKIPEEILEMKFDEEMEEAAKKIQEKYRTKQNNRQKKTSQIKNKKNIPEPIKKIPKEILDMKFDEEMEQAAKKIQNRYRKKQNNREKQPRNQQKESNVPPKHEIPAEVLNMKFDEEMEQAAQSIQKKYRKKQLNKNKPIQAVQNKNEHPKKTTLRANEKNKSTFNEPLDTNSDDIINMKFDEEMEQAAKKIQNKYRKKQNNKINAKVITPNIPPKKSPEKVNGKKIEEESLMVIEEGMEDAAKLIQKKYRAKQQNQKKTEEKIKNEIAKKHIEKDNHALPSLNSKNKHTNNVEIKKSPTNLKKNNKQEEIGEEIEESIKYWSGFEEEVSLGDVSQKDMDL